MKKPSSGAPRRAVDHDRARPRRRRPRRRSGRGRGARPVMSGPIIDAGSSPGADRRRRGCGRDGVDQRIGGVAHRDDDRDRHAPLAGRPVRRPRWRRRRRRRGRRRAARPCGSWRRRAPARACRSACRSRRCGGPPACCRRTTPRRRRGGSSSASTASPSPWTTLKTPSGKPACCTSSASSSDADGSFSDGLSTKALPHAMALAIIQSGTITGKLNGVMPATTPTGCEHRVHVDAGRHLRAECEPLSRCGMPQANSTFSRPRATSPAASDEHLAVLARDDRGQVVAVGVEQLAEAEQQPWRVGSATTRPTGAAASTATLTTSSTSVAEASVTSAGLHADAPGRRRGRCDPTCRLRPDRRSSARSCPWRPLGDQSR